MVTGGKDDVDLAEVYFELFGYHLWYCLEGALSHFGSMVEEGDLTCFIDGDPGHEFGALAFGGGGVDDVWGCGGRACCGGGAGCGSPGRFCEGGDAEGEGDT